MSSLSVQARGTLKDYTPEGWETALGVLRGESDVGVSWSAAARAAGVTVQALRGWVLRSEGRFPEDDPTIWAIAEDVRSIRDGRAGRLEDVAWNRALVGTKTVTETETASGQVTVRTVTAPDNKLLLRLLERHDETYRQSSEVRVTVDPSSIFQKLVAEKRLAEAAVDLEDMKDVTPPVRPLASSSSEEVSF